MMRTRSLPLFLAVLAFMSIAYWSGVANVPFHPDESTFLFLSSDLETLWRDPQALSWQPGQEQDPRQRYRELDAPMGRILVGLGRRLAGFDALATDWDWGKTWAENAQSGALPPADLLFAGRMAAAVWFPVSLLFLFLAARRAMGDATAWLATLLVASNALILLHTRRAMAEGPLLVMLTLTLWSLVKAEKRPWLIAIPAGLAFCAKQSLGALGFVGLLAIFWQPGHPLFSMGYWRRATGQALGYCALYLVIVFLMNPFLWSQPVAAARAAMQARRELAAAQTADRPEQVLDSPGRKMIGLVGSLYVTPPAFAETGNYTAETRATEEAYLANPLHNLFRGLVGGGLLFTLSLFGIITGCRNTLQTGSPEQRRVSLLVAATILQTAALLVFVPLPWQRYYLPLVPLVCLWTAYGAGQIIRPFVVFRPGAGRPDGSYRLPRRP